VGETTTLDPADSAVAYPTAGFEESVVETSPEIEATKASIEASRANMSATIDAIKDQLSPKRLVEEAKEAATEKISETVSDIADSVKEKVADVAHSAGEIAHNVVASVSGAASSLGDKVSAFTDSAKDKISDMTTSGDGEPSKANAALVAAGVGVVAAAGVAGDKAKYTGDLLMDTIKENPIPAALVGVGLGWLLVDAFTKNQQRTAQPLTSGNNYSAYGTVTSPSYSTNGANNFATSTNGVNTNGIKTAISGASDKLHETTDKISDVVGDAKTKVADTAHDLQEKASATAHDLQEKATATAQDLQTKASDIAHTVQNKATETTALVQAKATEIGTAAQTNAKKAAYATQDFVTENPLAAGAIALLVGAVIGLALPSTEQENKLVGTYRDDLADKAGQQAQDLFDKVQHVAGDALNVAKTQFEEAKTAVQDTVKESAKSVQDTVKESVKSNGLVAA